MQNIPNHPEIERALKTGYPSWNQPKSCYCEECGKCLDDEQVYEDTTHRYLCKECLLILHEKDSW